MKLICILIFIPSLVFGQNIKLICEENSSIDYVDDLGDFMYNFKTHYMDKNIYQENKKHLPRSSG